MTDPSKEGSISDDSPGVASDSSAYTPGTCLTKSANDDILGNASPGGASDSSAYPPGIVFLDDYYALIRNKLSELGFHDIEASYVQYILDRVGYVHLYPYLTFVVKHSDKIQKSVLLAHEILTLDRQIQSILLRYIGIAEMQFRAQFAAWAQTEFGEFALYSSKHFSDENTYNGSLEKLKSEAKRECRNQQSFKIVMESNDNRLPINFAVECMTLGTLLHFYDNIKSGSIKMLRSGDFSQF